MQDINNRITIILLLRQRQLIKIHAPASTELSLGSSCPARTVFPCSYFLPLGVAVPLASANRIVIKSHVCVSSRQRVLRGGCSFCTLLFSSPGERQRTVKSSRMTEPQDRRGPRQVEVNCFIFVCYKSK